MIKKHPVAAADHVSMGTRIGWGFGGLADNFMFNTMAALGTLVYVNHFKLSPALAGMALGLPRLVDAITDLWIGNLSDNAKSRFGRRRPFMFWGVLGCVVLLPLLWTLPMAETAGNPWFTNIPFLYIVVVGSMLATTYTLFVVPYTALGFELTPNYDERTRVVRWRMYIGLGGSLAAGWLFRIASADYFPNLGAGAFWVTVGVAVIVLISGMIPVFACKENLAVERQEPIRLIPAVKYTMTNKAFIILFIAYVFVIVALFSAQGIAPLLMQHYVFGGDAKALGNFQGLLTTCAVVLSYGSMILIGYISTRTSKRIAMIVGLSLALIGVALSYFAMDPRWPWAMYITNFIAFLGLQGCWLMVDSMVADVCDDDELTSNRRREGMFSAVKGFALKAAQALTFGLGGYLAVVAGYDPSRVDQIGLDTETAVKMKLLVVGFQSLGLLLAIIVFCFYPITRRKAEETRRLLDERKNIMKEMGNDL
jgi:GPH family glycoside/pentoside/hexuronide:cation symporter